MPAWVVSLVIVVGSAHLLAYYGGLTYLQVAATLGIAEGTAKSRLRQALRSLAARLAKAGVLEK